jgi:hypothetical protein
MGSIRAQKQKAPRGAGPERLTTRLSELADLVLAGQKIPDHKPPKFSKDEQIKLLGFNASV